MKMYYTLSLKNNNYINNEKKGFDIYIMFSSFFM